VGRHVGARARDAAAAPAAGEDARGGLDLPGLDPGASGRVLRRELGHRVGQRLEARDVALDEGPVVEPVADHHVEHRRQQRRVLAGPRLQVDVREARDLAAPRVDHDELHAAALRFAQPPARIRGRDAARDRDQRVVAEQQPDVGLVQDVGAAEPAAVDRVRDVLAGLIDRARREDHLRAEREHPADGRGNRGGMRSRIGADVERDATRPVAAHELADPRRDLVHRDLRSDRLEAAVGAAAPGVEQPFGMGVLLGQPPALRAAEAAVGRILAIPRHAQRATVLHLDEDPAVRVAEATDRGMRLEGHRPILSSHPIARIRRDGRGSRSIGTGGRAPPGRASPAPPAGGSAR